MIIVLKRVKKMKAVFNGMVLLMVFVVGCASQQTKTGRILPPGQHAQRFKKTITKTISCQYLVFLPEGYGKKNIRWPMILFLTGGGMRGNDIELVKRAGIPMIVKNDKEFPFVVISPQCAMGEDWSDDILMNLLDEVVAKYDVDTERIYLTGLSMGGYGTWYLAQKYPKRFAAIAPVCGGGCPQLACNLKDIPVWAFHGAKDVAVRLDESKRMVDAVNKCGGDAKLTIYPEAGHDAWTETYNNKQLYDWFLSHSKKREKRII